MEKKVKSIKHVVSIKNKFNNAEFLPLPVIRTICQIVAGLGL
jgi:hypothetical protein